MTLKTSFCSVQICWNPPLQQRFFFCIGYIFEFSGAELGKVYWCDNSQSSLNHRQTFRSCENNSGCSWTECNVEPLFLTQRSISLEKQCARASQLHETLQSVVKAVNYIKHNAKNTKCCQAFCQEMGSGHEHLLYHAEIRWLSKGNVLSFAYDLRSDLAAFLAEVRSSRTF